MTGLVAPIGEALRARGNMAVADVECYQRSMRAEGT